MDILNILKELTRINAPSGCENAVREYISSKLAPYCDELKTDALGNLTAHRRGAGKKVMFAAHMDEIGVIVTAVDDKGFIRFSSIGGLTVNELPGRRVEFPGDVFGVIGVNDEKAFKDKPSLDKLFIDVGAKNKTDAEKLVNIGDAAVFTGEFVNNGSTVISKSLDNRAGCAVLMKAISMIKNDTNDLYFVFTAQEEVGLRGAKTAAYSIDPDIAIAVDVTDTGDTPGCDMSAVKMGGGAAVKVMDRSVLCDAEIRVKMIETAKKYDIPYQLEVMTDGGTDAGAIHLTRAGVKTGGVSIPVRYIHSPSETADAADIENCAELIHKLAVCEW